MKFIDKLERKYGRYGIRNLTMYIIACYVLGYILVYTAPWILSYLSLDVRMILKGQIWRLVTWVIYPPTTGNFFLFLISIVFFYYPIGTSLERTWGSFRYTLLHFFRTPVYRAGRLSPAFDHRRRCGDRRSTLPYRRKHIYHILYKPVCFSGLRYELSGHAAAADVCDPGKKCAGWLSFMWPSLFLI